MRASSSLLPSPVRRAFLAVAAALVAAAAPGAAQETVLGKGDPPLSVFLDSAGLARAVAALPAPAGELPVPPLFWVEFDTTGAVKEVVPVFSQLPAGYAGPVAAAIRGHLKPQAPSRDPIFTHLRVVAGPAPQVDRPPIRRRAPGLMNRGDMARALRDFVVARQADRRPGWQEREQHRAEVLLRALADGTADASSVEVVVSTGDAALDAEVARIAAGARFTPGTVEDIPAPVWVQLPIEVQFDSGQVAPPVSAVVDSAALARALAGLPAPPRLPRGMRPLFRVRFDTDAEPTVEAVYAQIPASYADPVAAAIRTSLKPEARPWESFFLRVAAGPRPEVGEVPTWFHVELGPQLANAASIQQMAAAAARRLEEGPGRRESGSARGPGYEIAVRVRVLQNGRVDPGSIRLLGSTGEPELDREAVRIAGEMRFRPASVNVLPAIGWAVERVVFRAPPRADEARP